MMNIDGDVLDDVICKRKRKARYVVKDLGRIMEHHRYRQRQVRY